MFNEDLFLKTGFSDGGNTQKLVKYILRNKNAVISLDDLIALKKEIWGKNRILVREMRRKMVFLVRTSFCLLLDSNHITYNPDFFPLEQENPFIKPKRGRPRKNKTL
jgi:hypothetical protein